MAGIICRQCGYENPEGSTICEICAEDLVSDNEIETNVANNTQQNVSTQQQNNSEQLQDQESQDDGKEYYVLCPESQTRTVLSSGNVTRFFCEGCKKEHDIDGFLWNIESRLIEDDSNSTSNQVDNQNSMSNPNIFPQKKEDNLYLEEMNTHYRIDIDKAGGILGRYGKYGADYFQRNGLLTVSGEHCMLSYEFGNWVIRHISKTNETKYNNMILGANEPNLLEDGKVLTLANSVSFIVRIG